MKKELDKWIDRKSHEFTAQENMSPILSKEKWLERFYTHTRMTCSFVSSLKNYTSGCLNSLIVKGCRGLKVL